MVTFSRFICLSLLSGCFASSGCAAPVPAASPTTSSTRSPLPVVTKVRIYPRSDWAEAATHLKGGKIQGSNQSRTQGFEDLATIEAVPPLKAWTEIPVKAAKPFRYLRYFQSERTPGSIAEIEFYSGDKKLTGVPFGTRGSFQNKGGAIDDAFDGKFDSTLNVSIQAGVNVGLDLRGNLKSPPEAPTHLTAVAGAKRVWLSWLSPQTPWNSPPLTYIVTRAEKGMAAKVVGRFQSGDFTPAFLDNSTATGKTYVYTVSTGNAHGQSPKSPSIEIVVAPVAAAKTVTIMPLGDSITLGNEKMGGYRGPLFKKLRDAGYAIDFVGPRNGPTEAGSVPTGSGHAGFGGWEAWELAGTGSPPWWEPQDAPAGVGIFLPQSNPRFVLLMVGTNDMLHGQPNIVERIDALVKKIFTILPETRVMLASVPMNNFKDNVRGINAALPALVKSYADKGRAIEFVNMEKSLDFPADYPDGVHPNDAGYAKMANAWFQALKPHLKKPAQLSETSKKAISP